MRVHQHYPHVEQNQVEAEVDEVAHEADDDDGPVQVLAVVLVTSDEVVVILAADSAVLL